MISKNNDNPITEPLAIQAMIDEYIDICMKEGFKLAEKKQEAEQNHTYKQHMIPNFLLKGFSDSITQMNNRIKVIEYSSSEGKDLSIFTDFKKTDKFSVNENIYTMDEYQSYFDKTLSIKLNNFSYKVEYMLAVIEGDAAPLIQWRNNDTAYYHKSKPYSYKLKNSNNKRIDTTQKQRIVLSVFFAAQYLRSPIMKSVFDHLNEKSNHAENSDLPVAKSFGQQILNLINYTAFVFYFRSWVWTSFKDTDLFITENAMAPYSELSSDEIITGEEKALFLPLGRNKGVFLLGRNDFMKHHDSLLIANDIEFSTNIVVTLMKFTHIEQIGKDRKTKIVMHPETNLQHLIMMGETHSAQTIKKQKNLERIAKEIEKGISISKPSNRALDSRIKRKDPIIYSITINSDPKYSRNL